MSEDMELKLEEEMVEKDDTTEIQNEDDEEAVEATLEESIAREMEEEEEEKAQKKADVEVKTEKKDDDDEQGKSVEKAETPSKKAHVGPPKKISGIKGTVSKSQRRGIQIEFNHEGKKAFAELNSGLAYLNGSRMLVDVCKTSNEMALLLPKGTPVTFDALIRGKSFYEVTLMWVGQQPMANVTENLQKRLDWVKKTAMSSSTETPASPPFADDQPWFVKAMQMPSVSFGHGLPDPDKAERTELDGTIKALHRPTGGVVELDGGEKVFFHRARVFLDGEQLSPLGDLLNSIPVGTKVKVDCVPNKVSGDGDTAVHYFDNCPVDQVALLVYTGERPHVPQIIFNEVTKAEENLQFHIAKIVSFDPPGESGVVEGGVAELLSPSEYDHLCRDFLKKKLAAPEDGVKKVRFHRKNMFHLGSHVGQADLRFLFSKHSYGSNVLFCRIRPLDESEVKDDIKHEMEVGWRASDSHVIHLDLAHGYIFHPVKKEDGLLLPSVFWSRFQRMQAMDLLALEGFDAKDYLDIIQGKVSYDDRLKGVVAQDEQSQFAFARTTDLIGRPSINDPKKKASNIPGNAIVSVGTITIEDSRAKDCDGDKAVFDNTAVSIFGFKLEKANLSLFLSQNEPVWCKTVKNEGKANFWNKFKVTEMFVGSPYKADQTVESMSEAERAKFLLYLDGKDLNVSKFFTAIRSSQSEEKPFVPFRTEEIKGTVIGLDRDIKKEKQVSGGIIKVSDGPLKGQLAIFNRNHVWCMGRNMGRGDLTHLLFENQQVWIQVVPLKENNINKATTVHLLSNVGGGVPITLRAKIVVVCVDKSRPLQPNKIVNKNSNAEHSLMKRGLSWNDFEKLAQGTLPAVSNALATRRKSNMIHDLKDKKAWEVEKKMEKARAEKEAEKPKELKTKKNRDAAASPAAGGASAFRHGPVAERLCDSALSVSGPGDPLIRKMIKNDEQAQMAFHMYKALELAVDAYKKGKRPTYNERGRHNDAFGNYSRPEQVAAPWAQQQQQPHTMMITRTVRQDVDQHMGPQQGVNPWGDGSVIQIPPKSSWGGAQSTAAPLRMPSGGGRGGGGAGMGYGGGRGRGGGGGGVKGARGTKRQNFQPNGAGVPKKRKFNQGGRQY